MSEIITLYKNSQSISFLCAKDKRLAKLIDMVGSITYKPYDDPYEFLVGQIINQMLSNKVADVIFRRLETLCGGKISPGAINALTDAAIKSIGTATSKVNYIRSVTDAVINNTVNFQAFADMDDKAVMDRLTSIRGVGAWAAKMYLIFSLNRPDVHPYEDIAFLQTYKWLYKTEDVSPVAIIKR